jgi:pimeloyl-ACP methyl ester carboxylesterase
MDSPAQGAKGIPVGVVNFKDAKLTFSIANLGVEYEGELKNDTIFGTFKQMGMAFPLNLLRQKEGTSSSTVRPQEPKQPYPYKSEAVRFENKEAGITLAGTFTFPEKGENFPVAVLISGSSPQNRDEEVLGHRPFLVLSDYLTRNGIAVLRYDDRGVAESGGNYATATINDFKTDAAAAVEYLKSRKEVNPKKIGIVGHSQGGTIAFLLAGENKDVSFVVSMAGGAISGDSIMLMQRYMIAKKMGVTDTEIEQNEVWVREIERIINTYSAEKVLENREKIINEILPDSLVNNEQARNGLRQGIMMMLSPEIQSLILCDPANALTKINCPVFALNGEKDLQIAADINLERVKKLVKGNVKTKKYPNLNHLLQHCDTGLMDEYGLIEETISPEVLKDITEWIKSM